MSKRISQHVQPDSQLNKRNSVARKMAATAGALAFVSPAATQADVVFVDDRPISHTLGFDDFQTFWDVDGNGRTDFALFNLYPLTPITSTGGALYIPMAVLMQSQVYTSFDGRGFVGTMTDNVFGLNRGVTVGPTLGNYTWATDFGFAALRGDIFGFYTTTSRYGGSTFVISNYTNTAIGEDLVGFQEGNNFFGFRFERFGELHYGWAEMNIDGRTLTLSRWAYERFADIPIQVGDGAPIPEPSSLTMLAMGAVGVMSWRKRKSSTR